MSEPVTREARLRATWRRWFVVDVLPFWQAHGFDPVSSLAYERLHPDGRPDARAPLRVRTQARQVHAFALAWRLGLVRHGREQALATLWALAERAWSPDGRPGWVHVLHPDGQVADARRDLYDHAFVLLMLASVARITDEPFVDAWIDRSLTEIDVVFAAAHGGYAETDQGGLPRRQNPHMHLLEALLALFEAKGEPRFLARAAELFALFETRFFDQHAGVLREFFAADWGWLDDGRSDWLEPGHLVEWVWLLDRYERASGRPTAALRARLLTAGVALGRHDDADGFLVDEVDGRGVRRSEARRLWTQTEYLKALVVQARTGDVARWAEASALSERLFRTYLDGIPAGTWRDRFTATGAPSGDHIPASTLYHLLGVLEELDRSPVAGHAPERPFLRSRP